VRGATCRVHVAPPEALGKGSGYPLVQRFVPPTSHVPLQHSPLVLQVLPSVVQHAPAMQACIVVHVPHDTEAPQLFVALPQTSPVQAMPLSAQQLFAPASPAPHGPLAPHVFVQLTSVPQLLVAVPHASPVQAIMLSTQQLFGPASPAPQRLVGVHVFVQVTGALQLLTAGPQATPVHAIALSTQQLLGPASPTLHGLVAGQLFLHWSCWRQLLIAEPHMRPWQAMPLSVQHMPLRHTALWLVQAEHVTLTPQLLVFVTPPQREPHVVE
jgi:hypothetical protein